VVQGLGGVVGDPDLQRAGARAAPPRLGDQGEQQACRHLPAVVVGVDRDVGHVRLIAEHHQAGVADHPAVRPGHDVEPGRPLHDLRQEQRHRPGPRVDAPLDVEHLPDVAPPHRHQFDGQRRAGVVEPTARRVQGRHDQAPAATEPPPE
jgi:hypothetical protein